MSYNEQQQKVITTRDQDILVPASAGSGKTTVLVERVLRLLDEDPSLDIDNFLLMTFTKDAAKNMRVKIQRALVNSQNSRLQSQAERVAMADISTIDAFCQEIIHRYYYVINLDPQYRLMSDETEKTLLQNQAWDDVREQEYIQDEAEKDADQRYFDRLVANFAGDRSDDQLYDVVHDLYDEALAKPDPRQWLASLADNYQLAGDDADSWSFFQSQLKPAMLQELTTAVKVMGDLAQQAEEDQLGAFADQLANDQQNLENIQAAVQEGQWETIKELLAHSFPRARTKGLKKGSDKRKRYEQLKPQRDEVKKQVQRWNDYFALSRKQVGHFSAIAARLVGKLAEVVKKFSDRYQEIKRDRHLLDFADLEHFAYQILTVDSPEGRRAQEELRFRYREIMVDEYQDTNKLQDAILNRLKNPGYNHLFMVGDVKQAIYRFRQADPTIFRNRNHDFAANPERGISIPLATNYRSRANILSFINCLFQQLMDERLGDVDYDQTAQLKFGAEWYKKADDCPVEMMLYSANHQPASQDAIEADKITGEVRMIAMRIKQLVANGKLADQETGKQRSIDYRDIAILSRTKGINNAIVEQFGLEDIPVTVQDVNNFFASTEVRLMLDLLSLLDNPYQDIPLVAVLRSPLVGMTEPEMAYLRLVNRNVPYYQALINYRLNQNRHIELSAKQAEIDVAELNDKVRTFLDSLSKWRQLSQRQSLVKLIWTIYQDTGYLDYAGAMPGGEQRQANLHALYQRADDYEQRGYQGVYQFVRFIHQLQKHDKDIGQASRQAAGNSVSVMTIHGSKGLEFPVVFLADTGHQFKNQTSSVTIDADAGIGIAVVDQRPVANDQPTKQMTANELLSGFQVRYKLPQRQLIADQAKLAARAEDLRILYVALTRAEQRLIITGSVNDHQQRTIKQYLRQVEDAATVQRQILPLSLRLNASSYLSWILMGLTRYGAFDNGLFDQQLSSDVHRLAKAPDFEVNEYDQTTVNDQLAKLRPVVGADSQDQQQDRPLKDKERQWLNDVLSFRYGHQAATVATAFQSVSLIRGMVSTDPDDLEMGQITFDKSKAKDNWQDVETLSTPRFAQKTHQKAPRTLVGTATHLVFQKLPLEPPVTVATVDNEINRLVEQGLIPSQEVAAAIDREGIAAFYQTAVGQTLLADPSTVHREQPFSMIIPAAELNSELSSGDGTILVHGIIDGLQYREDGITLFDYKTDLRRRGESQERFEQRMLDHYAGQLTLYADALNKMTAGSGEQLVNGQPVRVTHQYLYLVTSRMLLPVPLLK
ncbi:helicase-exonuclease AddAB subunit AddA [uncultured Limosilactobacillus sp.]|uniref:helicase-exonuclease AddAB subunit AddA n=1 Tax=uncultured Limosilactobacillus sp. TaxID=2837629 RepID=UPI0025F02216|nr:helicase-exonuclease AddAB subunit AddA [uncultured Limosilactobacillus sp.]